MPPDIQSYLSGRPKWLQVAASNLLQTRRLPTDEEYEDLANLCLKEVDGEEILQASIVSSTAFDNGDAGPSIRINRIDTPRGIDALADSSYIETNQADLFVVFGSTGAGKSSYARLLKLACGVQTDRPPLRNVFDSTEDCQSARISYSVDGQDFSLEWRVEDEPISHLRHVSVFDSEVADRYVDMSIESVREPFVLRFLSTLILISDKLQTILRKRKETHPKRLPLFPSGYYETKTYRFFSSLSHRTSIGDIESHCSWNASTKEQLTAMEKALADSNPSKTLELHRKEKLSTDRATAFLIELLDSYESKKCRNVVSLRLKAERARKLAEEDAKKILTDTPLEGIGSASWKTLWEAARAFSRTEAYPTADYPNVDGKCVLCNQPLSGESVRNRMRQFESFVVGELERAAQRSREEFKDAIKDLKAVPSKEDWQDRFSNIPFESKALDALWNELCALRTALDTVDETNSVSGFAAKDLVEAVQNRSNALESEIAALQAVVSGDQLASLRSAVKELEARRWISEQQNSLTNEVERLKQIHRIDSAISKVDTTSLTKYKNGLANSELIGAFQTRFGTEIGLLGGHKIRVTPKGSGVGKGKVLFDLHLVGNSDDVRSGDVLSEGERRVVALATFLADMHLQGAHTPFIFDDPITSLDQDYEEYVVRRLVEVAKDRQVIVFTHRLSLKALIADAVSKEKNKANSLGQEQNPTLDVAVLRTVGSRVGVVTDSKIAEKSVKSALNSLLDRAYALKKVDHTQDYDEYCNRITSICSDFRTLVERCVEEILLNNVVQRFRRSILTKDKLSKLSQISIEDADYLDGAMTKYSAFEHSQSQELPGNTPELESTIADIEQLKNWMTEFQSRS